eukprot:SAG25_NODE_4880_length_737_cov_1.053292_1_plen_174_part_00
MVPSSQHHGCGSQHHGWAAQLLPTRDAAGWFSVTAATSPRRLTKRSEASTCPKRLVIDARWGQNRWHSLVDCDHGDSSSSRLRLTTVPSARTYSARRTSPTGKPEVSAATCAKPALPHHPSIESRCRHHARTRTELYNTGGGDDKGIDQNQNWQRFPHDSTFCNPIISTRTRI